MRTITLELTFKNDKDYFKFMDDWGCSEGNVRIPSNCKIKSIDCDEGRICPKCGKVMILCEDEETYYQIWECDRCGYKEDE